MVKSVTIGIVPSFDDGQRITTGKGKIERLFLRRDYTKVTASVGAVPIILNPDMAMKDIMTLCDGIVISGGEDIAPSRYGQKKLAAVKKTEPAKRFSWEKKIIESCDKYRLPILGICYGMQRLNVHYGGTLHQDIPSLFPENIGHDQTMHNIKVTKDFLGLESGSQHVINSRHHQALDWLADGFGICAVADDGIVEAFEGRGHFGIQWHPESDITGIHVYRKFIEYCQTHKTA